MASKIQRYYLPSTFLILVLAISSGEALQCYECMSTSSATVDECSGEMITKSSSVKTVECSFSTMKAWHNRVQSTPTVSKIAEIFEVDGSQANNQIRVDMKCAKLTFTVNGAPITMRTCQTAEAANMKNPCESITKKIPKYTNDPAPQCALCEGDRCNSGFLYSPSVITAFLPVVTSIFMGLIYQLA